jgi:radical SAM superfamily enzyme YgiQ (UPF0313 family)
MPDIVLAVAPPDSWVEQGYQRIQRIIGPTFIENLGILYVGASLQRAGYDWQIVDGICEDWDLSAFLDAMTEAVPRLYFGFAVGSFNRVSTFKAIETVKSRWPGVHVTLGGIWASIEHEGILKQIPGVDSVVVGDGEATAVELADKLQSNVNWTLTHGLASRASDGEVRFSPRTLVSELDSLPIPDRMPYRSQIRGQNANSVVFSRGCHGSCTFCSISHYIGLCGGKRRRSREPVKVVEELEKAIDQTGANRFLFVDDDFIGLTKADRQRCLSFAREVVSRGLDIQFSIQAQPKAINAELLKTLRDAGLASMGIGVESWVNSQLRRYGKHVNRRDNLLAVETLDKLGISFITYLMPLDPYVTRSEIVVNIREMEYVGLDKAPQISFCNRLYLYDHLPLFAQCEQDNLVIDGNYDPVLGEYGGIPYIQKHADVVEIFRAAEEIKRIYRRGLGMLLKAGKEKRLPESWLALCQTVQETFQRRMFAAFKDFAENAEACDDGSAFICKKFASAMQDITRACSETTAEGLKNFQNVTVRIDGTEVSTRLLETHMVRIRTN